MDIKPNCHCSNATTGVEEEESVNLAFACSTARSLLKWLNLTGQQAREFIDKSPCYLPASEQAKFPFRVPRILYFQTWEIQCRIHSFVIPSRD
ncbi:hypothetical protein JVT61DRAFT_11451 [Boletus reticuloceps]|uniref:Uncharacterized protein n=1 Tax=Boletus reticuloceps TaxID=495285 RepID=A0A8I2YYX0_9AGAM|nr:hypothetical protein JVT61DRAFT_11451 [Boletus reticuloceps]